MRKKCANADKSKKIEKRMSSVPRARKTVRL